MLSMRSLSLLPLIISAYVSAHAGVTPALGVADLNRNNVENPSNNQPCGKVNIAQNIDSAQAVAANNGAVQVTAINFNGGGDGSRQFTARVDPTGTGNSFVDAQVTVNGDPAPNVEQGQETLTVQLPAGTQCTGGANGNRCILSMKSTANFGNCVVVTTGGGGGGGAAAAGNGNGNNNGAQGGNRNNNNGNQNGNGNNNGAQGGNRNNNNGNRNGNQNGNRNNNGNNNNQKRSLSASVFTGQERRATGAVARKFEDRNVAENKKRRIHARDFKVAKRVPVA